MTARVKGSRFAKPLARVAVVAASVFVLAFIGYAASPRAIGGSASAAVPKSAPPENSVEAPTAPTPSPVAEPASPVTETAPTHGAASPDDPVVLNVATSEEFKRLPGIGEKRANAILTLRGRLGRFRAIEDLLKVKGIGRATLKRLRPLVRLDPKPLALDGGNFAASTSPR